MAQREQAGSTPTSSAKVERAGWRSANIIGTFLMLPRSQNRVF